MIGDRIFRNKTKKIGSNFFTPSYLNKRQIITNAYEIKQKTQQRNYSQVHIDIFDFGAHVKLGNGNWFAGSLPLINIQSNLYLVKPDGTLKCAKNYNNSDALINFSIFDGKTLVHKNQATLFEAEGVQIVFSKEGIPAFRTLLSEKDLVCVEGILRPKQTYISLHGERANQYADSIIGI